MMCALCYPNDMCYQTREPVYIFYRKLELDSSTGLSVGALFIQSDHTTVITFINETQLFMYDNSNFIINPQYLQVYTYRDV